MLSFMWTLTKSNFGANERTERYWLYARLLYILRMFTSSRLQTYKMDLRKLGAVFFILLAIHGNMMLNYALWRQMRHRPQRRWWVRPVNRVRNAKGFYHNLVQELLHDDHEEFFSLYRMWPEQFKLLVELVEPYLTKKSIRTPLPTALRVAVTLLYVCLLQNIRLLINRFV